MRRVRFDPAVHPWADAAVWARWEAKAAKASKEMRDWFDARSLPPPHAQPLPAQPDFKSAIWGDLKDLILEAVFRGRCAFCEVDENVNAFGDAEHYRPKRPVEAHDANGKMKPIKVGAVEHPGYGWLAYDWQNLVPACSKCNTFKANQFPLGGTRCESPAPGCETSVELNASEAPLLLHPYFDQPEDHLVFGERGVITARKQSARGKATIEVCRLDREPLTTARDREQKNAWREVRELTQAGKSITDAVIAIEERCKAGDEKFSIAVLDYIYLKLDEHIADLKARQAAAETLRASRRT